MSLPKDEDMRFKESESEIFSVLTNGLRASEIFFRVK